MKINKQFIIKNTIFNFEKSIDCYLIYGDSFKNLDLYYITNFKSEDPFYYLITKYDLELILISDMEKERAFEESSVSVIKTYSEYNFEELTTKHGIKLAYIFILEDIFKQHNLKNIGIPEDFPSILYYLLKNNNSNFNYIIVKSPLEKTRSLKTNVEIRYIQKSINAAEYAMKAVIMKIKKSKIKLDCLYDNGKIITGDSIFSLIETKLLEKGCYALNTIVSCGKDTEKPHGITKGVFYSDQPIIIDIFPKSIRTQYYGDMTRTILHGTASEELKNMYHVIKISQEEAIKMIKPNISCEEIHGKVCDIIEDNGYDTIRQKKHYGFIHSTGHGVGLNIHELPFISNNNYLLQKGNVITIEPGLYYSGIGGIRIEDTIVVTKNGSKNLNKFEKQFEI